jgi:hypothetical protein
MDHISNQIAVASIKGSGTGATVAARLVSRPPKVKRSLALTRRSGQASLSKAS